MKMNKKHHACLRAVARRIPDEAVARVVAYPHLTWPSVSTEGRAVTVCQRGAIRVIVGDDLESIVSVIWVHSRTGGSDPSPEEADRLVQEVLA